MLVLVICYARELTMGIGMKLSVIKYDHVPIAGILMLLSVIVYVTTHVVHHLLMSGISMLVLVIRYARVPATGIGMLLSVI